MIRDRLPELLAARKRWNIEDDEGEEEETIFQMDSEMKDFFVIVEEIRELLYNLQNSVAEIQDKHSVILSSMQRDANAKNQLEYLMSEIQKNSNSVSEKLRSIMETIEKKERLLINSALLRMQKMQHSGLLYRFVEIIIDYNRIQIDFRECSKTRIQRQLEITGRSLSNEELNDMLEQENPSLFLQNLYTDTEISKQMILDIQYRHADIIKLETSIRQLHSLFKDMQMIVESQGDLSNCIQYNVNNASEYVDLAKRNTKKALKYQLKNRRKQTYVLICSLLLVILIIVICFFLLIN